MRRGVGLSYEHYSEAVMVGMTESAEVSESSGASNYKVESNSSGNGYDTNIMAYAPDMLNGIADGLNERFHSMEVSYVL